MCVVELLFVLQASQGLIGSEFLAVSIQAEPDEIIIHVCLREDGQAVSEDLDDLLAELDSLQAGVVEPPVRVTVAKYVGDTDSRWPGYAHRRIFLINDRER